LLVWRCRQYSILIKNEPVRLRSSVARKLWSAYWKFYEFYHTNHSVRLIFDQDANMRVDIAGQKVRPQHLTRGQELDLYVSVDRFTQPIPAGEPMINEVLMHTETEELAPAPAEEAVALPTTG